MAGNVQDHTPHRGHSVRTLVLALAIGACSVPIEDVQPRTDEVQALPEPNTIEVRATGVTNVGIGYRLPRGESPSPPTIVPYNGSDVTEARARWVDEGNDDNAGLRKWRLWATNTRGSFIVANVPNPPTPLDLKCPFSSRVFVLWANGAKFCSP